MKTLFLAGAALLSFSTLATAQEAASPTAPPPADGMTPPAADPAMPPAPPADTEAGTMAADPNAGQPTGAVPADTGMTPAPAGMPRDPAAPVGSAANPVTFGGNMTPPPAARADYPVCSKTVQDSCINPREAGKARIQR